MNNTTKLATQNYYIVSRVIKIVIKQLRKRNSLNVRTTVAYNQLHSFWGQQQTYNFD